MKSVLIVYNQANNERVEYMLDMLGIRGFTFWENVQGRGHEVGDPHRGTHTWPELNNAIMTVVEDDNVDISSSPSESSTSAMRRSVSGLSSGISNKWPNNHYILQKQIKRRVSLGKRVFF